MCGAGEKLNTLDLRVLFECDNAALRRTPRSQETLPDGDRLISRTILYMPTLPILWARIAEFCTEYFHVQALPTCAFICESPM